MDHARPTSWMNPVHTILHVGTNDQPTWKNYDEIAKSVLQLASAL